MKPLYRATIALMATLAAATCAAQSPAQAISTTRQADRVTWTAAAPHGAAKLRLARPDGTVSDLPFARGPVVLEPQRAGLADGRYFYELSLEPPAAMDPAQAQATMQQRITAGSFVVIQGQLAVDATEPGAPVLPTKTGSTFTTKDQVVADDLIVQGSLCAGFDCVNNESFGFDTLRLKENNLGIHFDDTSVGTFPANDWRIRVNDTASGGASYFTVEDATANRQVFTVSAGAPSNSLYVSSTGRLGLRTATPVLDVHTLTGNTPAIRLEQSSAGGFTAQTWDIGANEANFFVRDVTNGSRLPLRIRPGAPTSSLDIAASGAVGIGTASPGAALHVRRTDGTAQVLVQETSGTTAPRTLLNLANNGPAVLRFTTAPATGWDMTSGTALTLATQGAGTPQFTLAANGNLAITGTLSTGSSRTLKTGIEPVNGAALLEKVLALPLYHWRYKSSPTQERHVGPMAEDFRKIFQLGQDDKSLAPGDLAGVTLGAVQALARKVNEREADIAAIRARISLLEAQMAPTGAPGASGVPTKNATPAAR
ncbi:MULTISPECIES: tail fiber domain-containing protein [unclassified Acidovorax]|uniref:tail fiber domain-containing protein n=1 Tax=unclassified Acidovorax TaxID=2684926 RepID=UPI001C481D41|nr:MULTISPECIES: tail fiber domain-containing protein [unclassified Acidovorax]MBV7461974.1 tail fiber domain-containing protein [Acidovorax sp. sif0632]MBV7467307.1 tail fiber domain-containing protein [Acidovorax sp. sif0613]